MIGIYYYYYYYRVNKFISANGHFQQKNRETDPIKSSGVAANKRNIAENGAQSVNLISDLIS